MKNKSSREYYSPLDGNEPPYAYAVCYILSRTLLPALIVLFFGLIGYSLGWLLGKVL